MIIELRALLVSQIFHIDCHVKPIFFLFLYIKFCVVYTHFTYVALKFQSFGKMMLK